MKAIRFPRMSQKEFASVVIHSNILTPKEVGDMMKLFSDVLTSPTVQAPRVVAQTGHRVQRFGTFKPPLTNWVCGGMADYINFTVNKPITLYGVQHFGSEGGKYKVYTEIKDTTCTDVCSLVIQFESYTSEKDETYDYYGFDVRFDRPVCLEEGKEYMLMAVIIGPKSWYGEDGQTSVECQGVRFTFRSHVPFRTTETRGQFPAFLLA